MQGECLIDSERDTYSGTSMLYWLSLITCFCRYWVTQTDQPMSMRFQRAELRTALPANHLPSSLPVAMVQLALLRNQLAHPLSPSLLLLPPVAKLNISTRLPKTAPPQG